MEEEFVELKGELWESHLLVETVEVLVEARSRLMEPEKYQARLGEASFQVHLHLVFSRRI